MEKVPTIDPATGLPGAFVNGAIDPATGLPSKVEVAGAQKKMRSWFGAGDSNAFFSAEDLSKRAASEAPYSGGGTGGGGGVGGRGPAIPGQLPARTLRLPALAPPEATSPQMAGEKLAEVAQEGKDASGSNIYLGKELAKADVKFGTWSLETAPAAQPGGTKNEEEKLKRAGELADGATIAGRVATPGLGFSQFGPKETPPPSGIPTDSQAIPILGDLPTLGMAFRGAEAKPEQARGDAATSTDSKFNPSEPTNLLGKSFYYRGTGLTTNWISNFTIQSDGSGAKPAQNSQNTDTLSVSGGLPTQQGPSNVYSLHVVGYYNLQNTGSIHFGNRLIQSSGSNSYDRNSHYRLLEQLGTDGEKETKLALNYSNVSDEDRKKAAKSSVSETREEMIPPGTIDFRGADLNQALDLYGHLTGRSVMRAANLPSPIFLLDAKRPMTKSEAIRALDAAFAANGIAIVDTGDKFSKAAPSAATGQMGVPFRESEKLSKDKASDREMITHVIQVDANAFREGMQSVDSLVVGGSTATVGDVGVHAVTRTNDLAVLQTDVRKYFETMGVNLSPQESVFYNDRDGTLIVRATPENGKIIKAATEVLNQPAPKINIAAKFSEISSNKEQNRTTAARPMELVSTYEQKKRELQEAQRSQKDLATKLAAENIEASLPKTTMVEILDDAVPAQAKKTDVWDRIRGKGKVESIARLKLWRDESSDGVAYDPFFVQNEFESIKSDRVLGKVVEDLNLPKEWGKGGQTLSTNQAIALLKQKLDLQPVRNTSFVDIGAKGDKPEEAAKLANAVAKSYQEYRSELRRELSSMEFTALERRSKEQDVKVANAQREVERLRAELGIDDAKAAASQPVTNQQIDAAPSKPAVPLPVPQPEIQTRENAFSTFSLNVSDVSFKLAGASLEKGQMPEPASVRSEEFINAFDYRDPEAPAGVPVAFARERARYPYAQNRDLLRFSIKTAAQGRQAGRPLNLVLLMDNSGSMERADRVAIIREALKVLASQLQPQDKLSVITFARTAQLRVDGVAGNQAAQVAEDIGGLTPEGGTNIEEAMNLAYQTALRHYLANGINRVVLLTDGAANLGNVEPESLKQKVEANRKQGVALDCFGIGWEGFNDDLLEALSRNGDGRYGFINSPEEAATEFAGQLAGALNVAASDVKVQVEFNPARVTAYRQIGYAKHQLTKEQFRDNTVDAAEIAAQEAGNALYVIEANPAGQGPLGTVRVRFKVPGTSDYREQEWTVPFNGNAVALEHASPAMRLAATASAFSEWLASSPFAMEVTPDTLLRYLSGVPEVYGADARPKKLEWMIRQAKSLAGGEIRNSTTDEHR
jgi:Mg-chelatase subunit ChlD